MTPELETRRLVLRPLALEDAPQIQALFPQWEIVQYLSNAVPWPYPPDGALTFLRDVALPQVERGEAWHWSLRLKSAPDRIVGGISLVKGEKLNRGFWIEPRWQRQGLMTEAVEAVTEYWFEALKFPLLRAPKAIANEGSRRISQKTGMRLVGTEEHEYVAGRLPSEIWEVTAEEWRARRRRTQGT